MTPVDRWRAGLAAELNYWREVLKTGGGWPDDIRARRDPTTPLQAEIVALLPDKPRVRILDVGAGPMTILGKVWPGHEVEIQAIDALGPEYNAVLDELGIEPPVRTLHAQAESLPAWLGYFDLAYARNSLDHGYDPLRAIAQMLDAAPVVRLEHVVRVAELERHAGLHQWNFSSSEPEMRSPGGGLVIEGYGQKTTLSADKVEVRDGWIYATLRRGAAPL